MAISTFGKIVTRGSFDDHGQSYLTSGKYGETPEVYPLPTADPILEVAAGWAHCVSITGKGEVYTWVLKECAPSVKITCNWTTTKNCEKETITRQSSALTNQGISENVCMNFTKIHGQKRKTGSDSSPNDAVSGDETLKRRKVAPQQDFKTSIPAYETLSMPPCHVNLDPGVRITSVAAGGRHTLALSDAGVILAFGWGLFMDSADKGITMVYCDLLACLLYRILRSKLLQQDFGILYAYVLMVVFMLLVATSLGNTS